VLSATRDLVGEATFISTSFLPREAVGAAQMHQLSMSMTHHQSLTLQGELAARLAAQRPGPSDREVPDAATELAELAAHGSRSTQLPRLDDLFSPSTAGATKAARPS
jgi:hypothetical protein